MHEKNKYRHIPPNRYNLEKYRDINFWSYRPALAALPTDSDGIDIAKKLDGVGSVAVLMAKLYKCSLELDMLLLKQIVVLT